jgi:hypothetical protein
MRDGVSKKVKRVSTFFSKYKNSTCAISDPPESFFLHKN